MSHFAVLTASTGVDETSVETVMQYLQGATSPRRLSDCAVEIPFAHSPTHKAPTIDGIDVNIVATIGRQKRLLIADMDSTMITVECIDELADFAGKKSEVSHITERAMQGELDFEEALRARVAMLKGVTRSDISRCHSERVHLSPGARELVQTMNGIGAITALVSGGFTAFTDQVVAQLGFLHSKANTLLFEGDVLSGEVDDPICHSGTKLDMLTTLLGENELKFEDAIAVGDGANDLPMIKAAGLGVAYKAKPALKDAADVVLDHSDLTALLSLQGISADDYQR